MDRKYNPGTCATYFSNLIPAVAPRNTGDLDQSCALITSFAPSRQGRREGPALLGSSVKLLMASDLFSTHI